MKAEEPPITDELPPGEDARPAKSRRRQAKPRLEELLGDPLPDREAKLWSLLDETQRARALQRAHALARWVTQEEALSAKQAAADAGVSLVRFYQMSVDWRRKPSLEALGIGAAPPRQRRSQFSPAVNQILQSAVADLVRDDNASVRALALQLARILEERGVAAKEVPKHNTLRSVVESARRDRQRRLEVGNSLLLDHAACGLQRPDTAPWIVYLIVDAASHFIFGAAPGEVSKSAQGYAEAAKDAERRLASPFWSGVAWADKFERVQIVPAAGDEPSFDAIERTAATLGVGLNLTADRKSGRYVEAVIGRAIGVLPIWPNRVGARQLPDWAAERAPPLDFDRAAARISLAVDDHNAKLLPKVRNGAQSSPPEELTLFIRALYEG